MKILQVIIIILIKQKNGNYEFTTCDTTLDKWEEQQLSGVKIVIDFTIDKEGKITDFKLKY